MREWLITDRRGGFAMGTSQGLRLRKYHTLFAGIAGRGECAYLADWEVHVDGVAVWPHRYAPGVVQPAIAASFSSRPYPRWSWDLKSLGLQEGELHLEIHPRDRIGGFAYFWSARSSRRRTLQLRIRPFFAMRLLHGVGGLEWQAHEMAPGRFEIRAASGRSVYWQTPAGSEFHEAPLWYRKFEYPVELERGYPGEEDLFSAGEWETTLDAGRVVQPALFEVADHAEALTQSWPHGLTGRNAKEHPSEELFQLFDPPGIVAGFPWFGEWGRDTFISLPGLVMGTSLRKDPGATAENWDWAISILARWGEWIARVGMLPNLIERGGTHQWESADGSLWWSHALASLWQLSLDHEERREEIEKHFAPVLDELLDAIQNGRHLFLNPQDDLLHVTEEHTTWMDARLDGAAVTPRIGALPEINALWFQARVLQLLWSKQPNGIASAEIARLEKLAEKALGCREDHRCNTVFLHSLPLSPSFFLLQAASPAGQQLGRERLLSDHRLLQEKFFTPYGLRTLAPGSDSYRPRCEGDQCARDLAYHQGPAWGWLGGHFRMLEERAVTLAGAAPTVAAADPSHEPIEGQRAELYDAEAPFTPRGAPAQAWSLACDREAEARSRRGLDHRLSRVIARKFLNRSERSALRERTQ